MEQTITDPLDVSATAAEPAEEDLEARLAEAERQLERHEKAAVELATGEEELRRQRAEAEAEAERLALAAALGETSSAEVEKTERRADELGRKHERVARAHVSACRRVERLHSERECFRRRIGLRAARQAVLELQQFDPTGALDAAAERLRVYADLSTAAYKACVDSGVDAARAASFLNDRPRRALDAVLALKFADFLIDIPRPPHFYQSTPWAGLNSKKAVLDLIDGLDRDLRTDRPPDAEE